MEEYDVLIVGGGPVGLCFAKSLSTLGLSVAIIDKQPRAALENPAIDGRDIALTHLSIHILKQLGIWQAIPVEAISTIREARVFNGTSSNFMGLGSHKHDQLAFIVSNHLIRAAAYGVVKNDSTIHFIEAETPQQIEVDAAHSDVVLSNGKRVRVKLVVAADSRFSEMRKKMGIATAMHDFGKVMVVCQMRHDLPHHGIAQECFLYQKTTIAALPLTGDHSSIVITLRPLEAAKIMKLPEAAFNDFVSEKLQHRLGSMRLDSERYAHPLIGVYPSSFIASRFALIGDAAVGMHPVTAHGFNFGLKGQQTLSEHIAKAVRLKRDIGTKGVLMRYQADHKRSTRLLYLLTNGIVSLYTNDNPSLKSVRQVLLQMANKIRPIKSLIVSKLLAQQKSPQ